MKSLRTEDRYFSSARDEAIVRQRMEAITEPWRCVYWFHADRPGMTYVVSAATPRELVRRMRAKFAVYPPTAGFDIVRLFELPPPPGVV